MFKSLKIILDVTQSISFILLILNNSKYFTTTDSTQFLNFHAKSFFPAILIFIQFLKFTIDSFKNILISLKIFFPILEQIKDFSMGIFDNKHLFKTIKNTAIEGILILLFCRRQFSAYACINFGTLMLSKTFLLSWIEKLKDTEEFDDNLKAKNYFLFIGLVGFSTHQCRKLAKHYICSQKKRIVDLLIGTEILHISYLMKSLLAEAFFEKINGNFLENFSENSESFSNYIHLSFHLCSLGSQYSSLVRSYVTNKGIFRYYLISKIFLSIRDILSRFTELTRIRKTHLIINLWMKSPTLIELDSLNDRICVICRDEMTPRDSKILTCGHIFHTKCLKNWLKRQYCCPVCLSPISSGSFYSFIKKMDNFRPDLKSEVLNVCAGMFGLERKLLKNSCKNQYNVFSKKLPSLNPDLSLTLFSVSSKDTQIIKDNLLGKEQGKFLEFLTKMEALKFQSKFKLKKLALDKNYTFGIPKKHLNVKKGWIFDKEEDIFQSGSSVEKK